MRRGRRRGLRTAAPLLGRLTPGDSPAHRARAGHKVLALAATGLAVGVVRTAAPPGPAAVALVLAAAGVAGVALACGLGAGYLLTQLRRLWWVLLALAVVQTWLLGPVRATGVVAGLVTCLWAAAVVTGTTGVPALLDALVHGLRPLRRLGVDPDRVGLALVLTTTSIPVVTGLLHASRESAAARGLDRDPRAVLLPALVRTVAHAEAVSEALAARGLDAAPDDGDVSPG